MIGDHFKTINEENRFTMAVNGYSLYISGTDHDDRWKIKLTSWQQ